MNRCYWKDALHSYFNWVMVWGPESRLNWDVMKGFKLSSISADLESSRAISKYTSWLMFKENIDFSNLKIQTLIKVILFISKGVSGDIFKYIPRFYEGISLHKGIFFPFLEFLKKTS